MPRIHNDQGLVNFLFLKNVEALNKGHPFSFIVGPDAKPPSESMFNMSSGIQQNPPRTCLPRIAFRGTIKEKRERVFLPKPRLKIIRGKTKLPREGLRTNFGLKGAILFQEVFAPRGIGLGNGLLIGKGDFV